MALEKILVELGFTIVETSDAYTQYKAKINNELYQVVKCFNGGKHYIYGSFNKKTSTRYFDDWEDLKKDLDNMFNGKQTDKPQGYWNGQPCYYEVVIVEITERELSPLHWANCYVGKTRQAVKVFSSDDSKSFYLDNEDGSGLAKVLAGGSFRHFHRGIPSCKEIQIINDVLKFNELNEQKHEAIEIETDEFVKNKNPKEYERLQRLRQMARKSFNK